MYVSIRLSKGLFSAHLQPLERLICLTASGQPVKRIHPEGDGNMEDYGIKTYADLAGTCRGMVLANEIANHLLEPVSGDWAPWDEIFQCTSCRTRRSS